MDGVTDDIYADFLVEAGEILDQLTEQLGRMAQGGYDHDLLNALFRGFHTIKGGAGFLGLDSMVALCHAIEDRLNDARSGETLLGEADIDIIQYGLDQLIDQHDAISSGRTPNEVDPGFLSRLRKGQGRVAAMPQKPIIEDLASADLDEIDFDDLLDSLHGIAKPTAPAPITPSPIPESKPAPTVPRPAPTPANGNGRGVEIESTVRVDVRRLDSIVNLVGELVLARNRLKSLSSKLRQEEIERAVAALDATTSRLQTAVTQSRMQPIGRLFSRIPKQVRDIARQLDKKVDLDVIGAETELDRNLVEALSDPLVHLIRNAIDHGIETADARLAIGKPASGRICLKAIQEGDHVAIEISDDGAGIDPDRVRESAIRKGLISADEAQAMSQDEALNLIFLPGFSTRSEVSSISGRGVGMDVVNSRIREHNGHVEVHSILGEGSRFVIRVPLTMAVLPTLLIEIGDVVYALPLVRVMEVLGMDVQSPNTHIDGRNMLDLREHPIPMLDLREWLGLPSNPDERAGIVLRSGEQLFCLTVDRVRGREEVVIKALPKLLSGLPGYAGTSLTGDGRMVLILDVDAIYSTTMAA